MLIRPYPHKQESLQSYITRLSASNSWSDNAFSSFFRANVAPLRSVKQSERHAIVKYLVQETGHSDVAELVDLWEMAGTYKQYLDLTIIKICPKCFGETNTLPPLWWLENYLVCAIHSQLLVDRCDHCEQKIDRESLRLNRCNQCERPLTHIQSNPAIPDQYSAQIASVFDLFKGTTEQFIELFKQQIMSKVDEISGLHPLVIMNEVHVSIRRGEKRHNAIVDKYDQQQQSQILADDQAYLINSLIRYIRAYNEAGQFSLSKILLAFKPFLNSGSCDFFYAALYQLIINESEMISDCRVGIKWLETLIKIPIGQLTQFSKTHCKSLLLSNQGVASMSVVNVRSLVERYESSLIETV